MQKYWAMYEYRDPARSSRGLIRGYCLCRDSKDGISRAKANTNSEKTVLERVWITFLESDSPVHTLVYGATPQFGNTQALDNASVSMVKTYKDSMKKGKSKNKPRIRVKAQTVVDKKETPRYYLYTIITSSGYQENRNEP